MADIKEYINALTTALEARKDWLDKTELVNLKENLRIYQLSFASLYSIFLKKKLINEDPYKQETKIGELEVPETGAFNDAKSTEQLSLRLSNFDSQLDFLVNFFQFSVDFINLDRIKRILGLVRYIDWNSLIPDSPNPNTRAVAEITIQSKAGLDSIALSVIGEALVKLPKSTAAVAGILKSLTAYHKEAYKLKVRNTVTQNMSAAEANPANIKKKIAAAMPGTPFYQELIEEIIKEDYSNEGAELRQNILNSLKVAEDKPKAAKKKVSYKSFLIDGMRAIGASASVLNEIIVKIDENENTLANQKRSLWEKLKIALRQMMNSEGEERIIDLEYMDPVKAVPVKLRINYYQFHADLERKIRVLVSINSQGAASSRLDSMSEEQLVTLLEKTIREIQQLHRTLAALDEYYKAEAPKDLRARIKGIRPELAAVKNSFVKANQMWHEYSAQKEEEEQMKRLGITPTA
jgi:hypothetical protein